MYSVVKLFITYSSKFCVQVTQIESQIDRQRRQIDRWKVRQIDKVDRQKDQIGRQIRQVDRLDRQIDQIGRQIRQVDKLDWQIDQICRQIGILVDRLIERQIDIYEENL